ncbi:TIGR02171 family protein [Fibrobacter sp. UWEL]|uniref:TIGR02171 family lipoprotein n=1 Tax=Fibrobacter sp. UWEL TaxID=1896209 RepID=UPI000917731E|nr:TIGR02171 family protein [Fibrobacter sp. UWEL]SHK61840.1 TIGR02171 family protein [Fibrobacter sp. UWEL]
MMATACDSGSDATVSGSPVDIEDSAIEGMLRVHSAGGFAMLGTDKKAKAMERPQMRVKFDYDYSIGRSEVTCGEFLELQKDRHFDLKCENDSLPVADVTYYDAVLFANAKSKSLKKDTAYTYSSASFDNEGRCTNLEGFVYHPEVEGVRLPTEAEWTLVANKVWDPINSWNAENSDYKVHQVCSMDLGSDGICDMAGNVMEWVNDWLGNFADTTIINYAGAPDGGNLRQRVLKGGSYRDAAKDMKLYSRGDVYTVTSETHKEYIGFRLAYGAIPDAQWMDNRGDASSSRVIPLASPLAIRNMTGTYQAKIVFRNEETGNLDVVDFSSGVASVFEIRDTLAVYHPVISPDGKKVAFSTGTEGVSGTSSLYVRNLNSTGSNLVKLDVPSAAIPRWMVYMGDTSIVYVTDAGNNEDTQAFLKQSTWRVRFKDGKFGTPYKILDGAYHSGVDVLGSFGISGARKLRAHVSGIDTVWFNGDQACNASLSKDGSKKTLFLDFGSKKRDGYEGESYGVHERILMVDSLGNLVDEYPSPENYAFDHTEWVSDHLVIASLTANNGAHEKIVMVNTQDSSVTELVEGNELWHPDFWFKSQGDSDDELLDFDSAGVYYSAGIPFSGLDLRVKMEDFWTNKDEATVVALGSSRVMFGLNEKAFESGVLVNMGYSSGDFSGMNFLFRNYVLNHTDAKFVVVEFSPDFMITDDNTSWNLIYLRSPGFLYDQHHNFWPDGVSNAFVTAVKDSYKPTDSLSLPYTYDEILLPTEGWGSPLIYRDSNEVEKTYKESILANLETLRNMCKLAKERDIRLIALIPPLNPKYRETGAFGLYGISRSSALALIDSVKQMDLVLMDENKMGYHDYGSNMAYNTDHLSKNGAAQLTRRLDSLIRTLK